LFCLLVTLFIVSQVCWQVLSPGADINQYSVISALSAEHMKQLISTKCFRQSNRGCFMQGLHYLLFAKYLEKATGQTTYTGIWGLVGVNH